MTITWQIQTQRFPKYFLKEKINFFINCINNGTLSICEFFNHEFKKEYINKNINNLITYHPNEFDITQVIVSETEGMLYIEVPEPRASEFTYKFYTKCYCVPYIIINEKIEILDLYSVEKIKDAAIGLIVFYKNGEHLIYNKNISKNVDDKENLINIMCCHIFKY